MSAASRAALRTARSRRANRDKRILLMGAGAVVALFALAAAWTWLTETSTGVSTGLEETRPVSITGSSLPDFATTENDPAVGMPMPELSGRDFDGSTIEIADDGQPKVILFLAHWCPHCQAEVPVIRDWLARHGLKEGVAIYSIATATNSGQPNYPPSEWLHREGWAVPVLADDGASSAGRAGGVTSYPFFVFVNGDGTVAARMAGELPVGVIESTVEELGK